MSLRGLLRFLTRVLLFKLVAERVVYVRHNKYPHSTRAGSSNLIQWLLDKCECLFDGVIVHSGAYLDGESEKKRHYVPHPLYAVVPSPGVGKQLTEIAPGYFLMFGRIVDYKKIDQMIEAFPDNQTLVICGEAGEPEYLEKLQRLQRPNVHLLPGYLSEAEAQVVVQNAGAVILAHAESNVLVSGSFFYALSMQQPVFAVRTEFLTWLMPRMAPGTLFLADDIPALGRLVGRTVPERLVQHHIQAIQQEFGDARVHSELMTVLSSLDV